MPTLLVAHLHFCQHTKPNKKMQKSYQANAPKKREAMTYKQTKEKRRRHALCIKHGRESPNIKVCSPLKLHSGLTDKCHAICHVSYFCPF